MTTTTTKQVYPTDTCRLIILTRKSNRWRLSRHLLRLSKRRLHGWLQERPLGLAVIRRRCPSARLVPILLLLLLLLLRQPLYPLQQRRRWLWHRQRLVLESRHHQGLHCIIRLLLLPLRLRLLLFLLGGHSFRVLSRPSDRELKSKKSLAAVRRQAALLNPRTNPVVVIQLSLLSMINPFILLLKIMKSPTVPTSRTTCRQTSTNPTTRLNPTTKMAFTCPDSI